MAVSRASEDDTSQLSLNDLVPDDTQTAVSTVAFEGHGEPAALVAPPPPEEDLDQTPPPELPPIGSTIAVPAGERMPIDFPTALRLAGADNWAVQLAREQVTTSQAARTQAEALWLPNINIGMGYTRHEGEIQATNGDVVDVSRSSLFFGGGMKASDAPLTGSAGGPARLFVDLSLADALFKPLAARQLVSAAQSRQSVTFNNTLLEASLAYFELIRAQGRFAIASRDVDDAAAVRKLTGAFAAAGKIADAEVNRVEVESGIRRQRVIQAELAMRLASANLARTLQLNPGKMPADTMLQSIEPMPVPLHLVPPESDVNSLVAQAVAHRPELQEASSRIAAACSRVAEEEWRPWLPNVNLGVSGGAFGGGSGSDVTPLDGRFDFDAGLVWEVRNLGFGTRAVQLRRESEHRQELLKRNQLSDQIAAETGRAWFEVKAGREAMHVAEQNIATATEVYEKNLQRIQGLAGLPLEALQAVQAVSDARYRYLNTVTAYNQAQCRLLRAIGQPITAESE